MQSSDITVVIPSIPPRAGMLQRAITSVLSQTFPAAGMSIALDIHREGAGRTRTRALSSVRTPWVAFLDDDDEFKPEHLGVLWVAAREHSADYVYSWFDTQPGGCDPFPPGHFLNPWSNDSPRQTTVVTLVRTELAQSVGFDFPDDDGKVDGQRAGEDWLFTLGCMAAGAKIHHEVKRTWYWHHHGRNTSGLPTRW